MSILKHFTRPSRVANISLADLAGKRPIETLVNPHSAKIEKVAKEDINRAERLLAHLLLSEARRQRDAQGLTVMGIATKGHLTMRYIRNVLSGEITPPYSTIRQIVEDGFGMTLPHFLENFEAKLKSFDLIPFASKKTLLELEGLYLSERVKTRMRELQERFDSALKFVIKSLNIRWEDLASSTGIRFYYYKNKTNLDHFQVHTIIKLCHFFRNWHERFSGEARFFRTDIERQAKF